MKHSIIFSGNTVIWLGQDEAKIIDQMNKQLERFYGDKVKVVSVKDLGKDDLEIKVERELKGLYFIEGGWINHIDESIKLYKRQIKVFTDESVDDVNVISTSSDLTITVKYKDTTPRRYKQDIFDLEKKYGNLWFLRGQTIRTTLQDFSQICTRNQPKVSAYRGLKKLLLDTYEITLELTSNKSKG